MQPLRQRRRQTLPCGASSAHPDVQRFSAPAKPVPAGHGQRPSVCVRGRHRKSPDRARKQVSSARLVATISPNSSACTCALLPADLAQQCQFALRHRRGGNDRKPTAPDTRQPATATNPDNNAPTFIELQPFMQKGAGKPAGRPVQKGYEIKSPPARRVTQIAPRLGVELRCAGVVAIGVANVAPQPVFGGRTGCWTASTSLLLAVGFVPAGGPTTA